MVRPRVVLMRFYFWATVAMAVDRSKFRTCHQTSFCRRHRDGHSARLYQYELVPDSLEFHHGTHAGASAKNAGEEDGATAAANKKSSTTTSVWSSLSRRILGGVGSGGSSNNKHNNNEDYYRGTPPTLTGRIRNTAKETSTGTLEQLEWSLHAMEQGMFRMRVTEVYGKAKSAHEKPRVTYDALVLESTEDWKETGYAEWIRHDTVDNQKLDLLKMVVQLAGNNKNNNINNADLTKYTALQFGNGAQDEGTLVLLRLKPFAVYVFRSASLEAGPVVVMNAQSMMSFEIRRFQDGQGSPELPAEGGEEGGVDKKMEKEGGKLEKEIVGYWEDGLAIYSDGTREEKKSADEPEDQHRKLSEEELHELDRQGLWEESFGGHTDTKPYGPMSVGMDISFPQSTHLFGLPEHASSAVLQTTFSQDPDKEPAVYKEPYRLYNLDVFEYELDEPMALYGEVPMVVSQSAKTGTTGVFWFNPTETFVDIMKSTGDKNPEEATTTTTHWMSESGIVDIFVLPGPTPTAMYGQYAKLTGTAPMPPMFSLGYHQCRWNYKDEKDVQYVHGKFEELDYPYDVLWLDIEHTDGKRYFTWDDKLFPNPVQMQESLWATGRRMVTIVDPHIKRDDGYSVHSQATAKGLYIKDKRGKQDYDGWCWPGSSSYLDFTQEHVRKWWAEQFAYKNYRGSTPSLFIWNDMNEPSVFNGPEVSMQKDLRNLAGDEHREWHNLYGMLFHRATAEGLVARNGPGKEVRPFVLSRAFFAGSQKYGAIWTGDNVADWKHLQISAPMLLSLNTAALSFVGADVGGFFGDPDAELFTRWMQAGAYQPFFRGHGHHDSKRKEPWVFDDDTLKRCRRASMARYALLPFWYNLFHIAETTGMPVMRLMWMEYPAVEALYGIDHQYMLGSDLLVHPVVERGASEVTVLFPTQNIWYNAETLELVVKEQKHSYGVLAHTQTVDMDTIPVYQRGGSIVPRKLRLRRSSYVMKKDPYTLYVALDGSSRAAGILYMDDEESFSYETKSDFAKAAFLFDAQSGKMTNTVTKGQGWSGRNQDRMIERIIVVGMPKAPSLITCSESKIDLDYDSQTKVLVLRKPELSAAQDWTIDFK